MFIFVSYFYLWNTGFVTGLVNPPPPPQWAEMTFIVQLYNNCCKIKPIYKCFALGASIWLHFYKH